mmetsp:Transcript_22304/g.35533  ORF Transcript_22304/g.35533 Transcript_22304/m.35533 type:complete len:435 (+) Transcript_22304:955-2259(+)
MVQQIGVEHLGNFLAHGLIIRCDNAHHAHFSARLRGGVQRAQGRIKANHPQLNLERAAQPGLGLFCTFFGDICTPFPNVGHIARVTHKRERHRLITADPRALQLDGIAVGRHPCAALDPHATVIKCGIAAAGHIEVSAGLIKDKGIAVLIKHMGRGSVRRGACALAHRRDDKSRCVKFDQDGAGVRVGGGQRAAFPDLGPVPGPTRMAAPRKRQRRDDRGVSGPPGNDDVCAGGQGRLNLFGPGKGHNIGAAVNRLFGDRRCGGQRGDAPVRHRGSDNLCRLTALEHSNRKRRSRLGSNLARNLDEPVHRIIGPAGARRADHQRHTRLRPRGHQLAPLGLDRAARIFGCARPQIVRPAVGRPAINRDDVRACRNPTRQRRAIISQTQRTGRDQNLDHQSVTRCGFFSKPRRNIGAMNPATAATHSPIAMGDEKR